jgi:GPH family glycoside/pentoside/hexuronide:cation symporter
MIQNNYDQINEYRKYGLKGHLSYGCGDFSNNIAFGVITGMITFFCTDYAGISAGIVALILAVSRIPDAFSDFIMGLIVEHTHTKFGKCRPWIARMGIPLAVSMVLLFCVPLGWGEFAKAVYIFIAYNLFTTVCYTAVNLPYSALSSLMTRDQEERTKLCSWRMGMAPWGRIAAVAVATPMIKFFGDDHKAWIIVMAFWAAVSLIPLFICFRNCEEIVVATPEDNKDTQISSLKSIAICLKNPYWWAVGIMWGVTAASTSLIGSILPYYCKYNLGNSVYYSSASTSELIVMCVMAFVTPVLTKYIKAKRTIVVIGALVQ